MSFGETGNREVINFDPGERHGKLQARVSSAVIHTLEKLYSAS